MWLLNEFPGNVVDRKQLGQNVIGAKESFVGRNIALGKKKREKGESKGEVLRRRRNDKFCE